MRARDIAILAAAAIGVATAVFYLARDAAGRLPAFELRDHRDAPFTRADFEGRWSLVFAGFTHCPDICPDTLQRVAALGPRLQEGGTVPHTVFLSVDPARDTPERLADYVGHFDPGFTGVTGGKAQIDRLVAALGLSYILVPRAAGEYTVDHSAALVLVGPDARVVRHFLPPFDPERLATDLNAATADRN